MNIAIRTIAELTGLDRGAWQRLERGASPFLDYGFLRALERSGSVGSEYGWIPQYVVAELDGELVGAVAAYIKLHSYGEYIFDWAWANAAQRAGLAYYPKLVVAAPLTPATGRRILLAPGPYKQQVARALVEAVRVVADEYDCSSIHWLFTTADEQELLSELGFAPRASFQFHWHNQGYGSFDEFLERLKSRKRKQMRKERQRCEHQVEFVPASELQPCDVAAMDQFYRRTTALHGGVDYLGPGFFDRLREELPDSFLFARVQSGDRTIAGACYLETEHGLYGRYWGCAEQVEFLHFEVACYAGIERCIERGLPRFEAGAQGEHKLLRGFEPTPTYSSHWVRHRELDRAVRGFLAQEALEVEYRMRRLAEHGPYRGGD